MAAQTRPRTTIAGALAALALAATPAHPGDYRAPSTAFGAPDLEGTWTNAWLTKMERDKTFSSIVVPAPLALVYDLTHAGKVRPEKDPIGQETSEFPEPGTQLARIRGAARSSWIIEPSDGKIPWNEAAKAANKTRMDFAEGNFDNPDGRPLADRCLGGGGPPIRNGADANIYIIVQTRDHLALLAEANHVVRIIPITPAGHAAAHAPGALQPWGGDPIGHWEGRTLVVESTGFNPLQINPPGPVDVPPADPSAQHVTERFTRTGEAEITYEFRVENPTLYTQPWRGEMVLRTNLAPLYEYACHEGNYGLEFILAGARQSEGRPMR